MGQDRGGPLEVVEGTKAINHLEDVVVKAGGAVLRYGGLYGPGANDDQVELVRKRLFPLVGGGTGYFSWVHVAVTRISIDVLRSARVRREQYVGPWFPEPLRTDPYQDPERSAELADSVSPAALLLLERLSPLERAVFVLREVFGFGFPGDRVGGRALGGGLPPARGAGAAPHGRRAPAVRGGPPGAGETGGAVLRRTPGKATSTACRSCSPLTFSWPGTAAATPRSWPGASSALRRWPGCLPQSSPGSSRST
jgi:hypothetical protein